jgi:hypothetical protein
MALILERHRVEHHEWLVFDEEQPIAISKLHFEASADRYERDGEGITLPADAAASRPESDMVCTYRTRLLVILSWNPIS